MYRDTEYSDELIQRAYDAAMERMGPIGRVEKMCKMYHYENIKRGWIYVGA